MLTAVFFLLLTHEVGSNVELLNIHSTQPDEDFESIQFTCEGCERENAGVVSSALGLRPFLGTDLICIRFNWVPTRQYCVQLAL